MSLPHVIRYTGFAAAAVPFVVLWDVKNLMGGIPWPYLLCGVTASVASVVTCYALASIVDSLELLSADARAKRDAEASGIAPLL